MTLATAKKHLAAVGCTLTKRDGEYRVRLKGAKPGAGDGYFTDDLVDAVETGIVLAARANATNPNKVLQATVSRMIAAGSPVIVEKPATKPATKTFVVAAISTKPNSFGLHGIVLVAKDGEAWEVGHCQSSPPESAWKKGQLLDFPLDYSSGGEPQFAGRGCEIPRRLIQCPANVVKVAFDGAFRA